MAPGTMRTCSIPASRYGGQSKSKVVEAATNQPSETVGLTRLPARATARCPTNIG